MFGGKLCFAVQVTGDLNDNKRLDGKSSEINVFNTGKDVVTHFLESVILIVIIWLFLHDFVFNKTSLKYI